MTGDCSGRRRPGWQCPAAEHVAWATGVAANRPAAEAVAWPIKVASTKGHRDHAREAERDLRGGVDAASIGKLAQLRWSQVSPMFFPSVPTSGRRTTWGHDPSVDDRCHVANSARLGCHGSPWRR